FRNSDLHGYQIPGLDRKIIVNLFADDTLLYLFADDTLLYLSARDRYDDVKAILERWCAASGAKFNINKTEVLPIGTPAHRARVLATRRIHPDDVDPFSEQINIAPDRSPIRSLGAWIGNDVDNATPWSPVLDKINAALTRWIQPYPTLDSKRLILQMVVGGMTQYLTKVQSMPPAIEKAIIHIIRNFIWDGHAHPPISIDQLYQPVSAGGIALLDITARNEAINITWLRTYLDLSPSRP
ncbi:hypothetical protein BV25DRAFT_1780545, partial [Artomyces pyxidatus]